MLVAGNGDSIFKRLMTAIGRQDLADAPDLADNAGRVQRVAEIDAAIGTWTQARSVQTVMDEPGRGTRAGRQGLHGQGYCRRSALPGARDDSDPAHPRWFRASGARRGAQALADAGHGAQQRPHVGDDTDAVLAEIGLSAEQVAQLCEKGIIQ